MRVGLDPPDNRPVVSPGFTSAVERPRGNQLETQRASSLICLLQNPTLAAVKKPLACSYVTVGILNGQTGPVQVSNGEYLWRICKDSVVHVRQKLDPSGAAVWK